MTVKHLSISMICLCVGLFALGCGGGSPAVDFGDQSTGNLLWGASHYGFVDKDYKKALAFADKALELYGDEARSMQASLSDFPPTDPPEAAFKYKTLNDVGLIAFAKGEILRNMEDPEGAREAYTMAAEEFGYAQVQEFGEWGDLGTSLDHDAMGFIKVADAARMRLAELDAGGD